MQKTSSQKLLCTIHTDLQLNYNGYFIISPPSVKSNSIKFIENNKHRNWSEEQLQKFAAFLYFHHQKLATIDTRKVNRIFKGLSQYVQTRNVNQCRTFTSKMIKKFGNLGKLNHFFQESLSNYEKILSREENVLENILNSTIQKKKGTDTFAQARKNQQSIDNQMQDQVEFIKKHEWLKPTDTDYPLQQNIENCDKSNTIHRNSAINTPISRVHQSEGFFMLSFNLEGHNSLHRSELQHFLQNQKRESGESDTNYLSTMSFQRLNAIKTEDEKYRNQK